MVLLYDSVAEAKADSRARFPECSLAGCICTLALIIHVAPSPLPRSCLASWVLVGSASLCCFKATCEAAHKVVKSYSPASDVEMAHT
ncbi:hypothetical protein V5799_017659 [Amblyomma americanum]|uniref:Uncharacterized protein n=1 Tax=Amblyomma americanum TaxID=6943 RepID=A0AAQ4F1X5_AMBAM